MGVEIKAAGLALAGGHGPIYSGVSLTARPGSLITIVGPSGSGRTSLLLTLAGRMAPDAGTLSVGGRSRRAEIQRVTALALVTGVNALDGGLSVHEHLRERHGRKTGTAKALTRAGLDLGDLPEGDRTLARALSRDQSVRLGIALALLDEPGLLAVDDVDAGLPGGPRDALWRTLRTLADDGPTVVATCTTAPPEADVVKELS